MMRTVLKEKQNRGGELSVMIETLELQQLAKDQHQHFNTTAKEEIGELNLHGSTA